MNMNMRKQQSGFTLIELVIVIVILGILAAVALPRFVDLTDEAAQAAVEGVAGAIGSGMAINFAGCSAVGHDKNNDACTAVSTCDNDDANAVLQDNFDTTRFTVTAATAPANTDNGTVGTCTVTDSTSGNEAVTATYQLIVAGQ